MIIALHISEHPKTNTTSVHIMKPETCSLKIDHWFISAMVLLQASTAYHSVSKHLRAGLQLSVTSLPEKKVLSFTTWLLRFKGWIKVKKSSSPEKSLWGKPEWSKVKTKLHSVKLQAVAVSAKVFQALTFILKRMVTCRENWFRW